MHESANTLRDEMIAVNDGVFREQINVCVSHFFGGESADSDSKHLSCPELSFFESRVGFPPAELRFSGRRSTQLIRPENFGDFTTNKSGDRIPGLPIYNSVPFPAKRQPEILDKSSESKFACCIIKPSFSR